MTDRAERLARELRSMGVNAHIAGDELEIHPKSGGRQCGSCTLCCKLIPVEEIHKKANTRCEHQRHSGCAIYNHRPMSCQLWNCAWLINKDMGDQQRPERSHVVIAPDLQTFWFRNDETGERIPVSAIEMWVDPKYPDAYKDHRLRAFMERRGEQNIATLVRYSSQDGFAIFPPSMTGRGFVEQRDCNVVSEAEAREMRKRDLSLPDKTCTE